MILVGGLSVHLNRLNRKASNSQEESALEEVPGFQYTL
jgi:hypothetical protein